MTPLALIFAATVASAPAPDSARVALPDTVYVTEAGHTFHARTHRHDGDIWVLLRDAQDAGYLPCKLCFTPKSRKSNRPWDRLRRKP